MREHLLLVAIGCGRLPRMLEIAANQPFVVFGVMGGEALSDLAVRIASPEAPEVPVYFYETG